MQKPSRYVGGEYDQVRKDPATVRARVCLAFPDAYEIGMSHLGSKILYSLLNQTPGIACERVFAPWLDMEAELRSRRLPLLTLESASPLDAFDVVGFSLQYELNFTGVLNILDLSGLAAAHGRPARRTRRWCWAAVPWPPTPSRWRPSSTPSSSARPRSFCRRSVWRRPSCAGHRCRGRKGWPGWRTGFRCTCPACTDLP